MPDQKNNETVEVLTVEKTIDIIRSFRNNLIKQLLKDDLFVQYFKQTFNRDLSKVKIEFVRRELKELLIQPVDLVHYAKLINQIKEKNSASIIERDDALFHGELNAVFKKYCF